MSVLQGLNHTHFNATLRLKSAQTTQFWVLRLENTKARKREDTFANNNYVVGPTLDFLTRPS